MENQKDDTFLARWLNGKLSKEELDTFKADPEYSIYEKIINGADTLSGTDFDEEGMLQRIKNAQERNEPQGIRIRQLWTYGVAAAIVLLVGFYFVFSMNVTQKSNYGEQMAFSLPDHSAIILNANSQASFSKWGWNDSRTISLEGEAYFKVEKGSKFTVLTQAGSVSVLGTQFNVTVMDGLFEVTCYEGKVAVSTPNNQDRVLLPGATYREIDGNKSLMEGLEMVKPGWVSGQSTFKSMPMQYVLMALENQYHIEIEGNKEDYNQLFSGSFPHDDLTVALRIVFGSLEIEYTLKDQKVILKSDS